NGTVPISFTAAGGVLALEFSQGFTGPIAGFASPPGVTEFIDLKDIQFNAATTTFKFTEAANFQSATLTESEAANHTANLTLLGIFSQSSFTLAPDGGGGTRVLDPGLAASASTMAAPHTA